MLILLLSLLLLVACCLVLLQLVAAVAYLLACIHVQDLALNTRSVLIVAYTRCVDIADIFQLEEQQRSYQTQQQVAVQHQ